jgi:hypothetical protein
MDVPKASDHSNKAFELRPYEVKSYTRTVCSRLRIKKSVVYIFSRIGGEWISWFRTCVFVF